MIKFEFIFGLRYANAKTKGQQEHQQQHRSPQMNDCQTNLFVLKLGDLLVNPSCKHKGISLQITIQLD